jgi:hypothetical protein
MLHYGRGIKKLGTGGALMMTRDEYHEIVAKLIDAGHWAPISALWMDFFGRLDQDVYLEHSGAPDALDIEVCKFASDVLRDIFAQLTEASREWVTNAGGVWEDDPKQQRAFYASVGRDNIIMQTRERLAVGRWTADGRPPTKAHETWPAAIREMLMDIWNDPDGRLLSATAD